MTNKNLTVTQLKKYLSTRTQAELVDDILALYKNYSDVKDYYQIHLSGDIEQVFEKYKKIVVNEFIATGRSDFPKLRYSVARKAISDFKKISINPYDVIDLMLIYVEAGVECTLEFGDIDEPFYNSLGSMYKNTLELIMKHDYLSSFDNRLTDVVHKTRRMGWGFHEELSHWYKHYVGREYS